MKGILSVEVIVKTGIFVSRLASRDEEWDFIPGSYTEVRDVNVPSDQQKTQERCEAANFTGDMEVPSSALPWMTFYPNYSG